MIPSLAYTQAKCSKKYLKYNATISSSEHEPASRRDPTGLGGALLWDTVLNTFRLLRENSAHLGKLS